MPLEVGAELVTPTAAALLAATVERYGSLPPMTLESVGYGAGMRDLTQVPNVVRVLVGELSELATPGGEVIVIETNLDDTPGELVPDAAERAFAAGALDVWTTPVQMKKGRPGVVLAALARPADARAVAEAIVRETTALGVRMSRHERLELERRFRDVTVDGHSVRVKLGLLDGEVVNLAPEHDDCARAAAARSDARSRASGRGARRGRGGRVSTPRRSGSRSGCASSAASSSRSRAASTPRSSPRSPSALSATARWP